ncbi:MAG: hypothetical protein F6K54_06720 [Okeania sp. SIO3B5]|uniref:hypothetical protein n=1 Tax=Okeania sp. SIO3B5 TaxID=2607811 RepID=UPI00140091B9|nr:hypothetical protein [Okeania sp. SIO3B5]NEO52796.1 hypothetical protein [Okeania sp. SIO3B5]
MSRLEKLMGRWGDREVGGWGDGEMRRWGDREVGGWGDGEICIFAQLNVFHITDN